MVPETRRFAMHLHAISAAAPHSRTLLPRSTQTCRRPFRARKVQPIHAFMTKHDPAALQKTVMRFVEAVNSQDVEGLLGSLSPNVVWSDRVWSSMDLLGTKKVRKVHEELFCAYPDYTLHTDLVLARDDANTVAVHFTCTGTNFGEWRGYPASGRRSTFSGVSLFMFDPERDDKISQVITYRQPNSEEYAFYLGHEDM